MKLTLSHAVPYPAFAKFYQLLNYEAPSDGIAFQKMAITAIPPIKKEQHFNNITCDQIHFLVNKKWLRRTDKDESQYSNGASRHQNLSIASITSRGIGTP